MAFVVRVCGFFFLFAHNLGSIHDPHVLLLTIVCGNTYVPRLGCYYEWSSAPHDHQVARQGKGSRGVNSVSKKILFSGCTNPDGQCFQTDLLRKSHGLTCIQHVFVHAQM